MGEWEKDAAEMGKRMSDVAGGRGRIARGTTRGLDGVFLTVFALTDLGAGKIG